MVRQVEENIEILSRAVASEAQQDAEKILAEARAKADGILRDAEERAASERKEILDRAKQEAERIRGQVIATTQMKARTMQLEKREKLLDGVFERARKQLDSVQQWTEYDQIAVQLLQEALTHLESGSAIVRADPVTQKHLPDRALRDIGREMNMKIQMGEPLKQGVGVVAQTEDGHMVYDNTLETRMTRMQNSLRSPVYRILMGERL